MSETCSVEGCTYPIATAKMCDAHYYRHRKGLPLNDPPIRRKLPTGTPLKERLLARLDTSGGDDSCWEWQGHRRKRTSTQMDYGRMSLGDGSGDTQYIHIVSWLVHNGESEVPAGKEVCHHCDNPPCGNPAHLYLGDHKQNAKDMVDRERSLRGEKHNLAKLSDETVQAIRDGYIKEYAFKAPYTRVRNGVEQQVTPRGYRSNAAELAEEHGVSQATISDVITRRGWTHL